MYAEAETMIEARVSKVILKEIRWATESPCIISRMYCDICEYFGFLLPMTRVAQFRTDWSCLHKRM